MPRKLFGRALLQLVVEWPTFYEECNDSPLVQGTGSPFKSAIIWEEKYLHRMQTWLCQRARLLATNQKAWLEDQESLEVALWKSYARCIKMIISPSKEIRKIQDADKHRHQAKHIVLIMCKLANIKLIDMV
jgi:hypothetical protein